MQAHKALLSLVIVMGVLILAGTAGLIGVVVHRLGEHGRRAASVTASAPVPGDAAGAAPAILDEPPGTHILSIVRQSDTVLSVALTGGGPDRIVVWDIAANRQQARIALPR